MQLFVCVQISECEVKEENENQGEETRDEFRDFLETFDAENAGLVSDAVVECCRIYFKMVHEGINVSFETILRYG